VPWLFDWHTLLDDPELTRTFGVTLPVGEHLDLDVTRRRRRRRSALP